MISQLTTPEGRVLAYEHLAGKGPTVVFCGGYRSDMEGTKALALRDWAQREGRAFMRFDYSGHGVSEGDFFALGIADWLADARAILSQIEGKVVLVGSSMGGWISLLLAQRWPEKIAGLVGIAAAPDFSEDLVWAGLSEAERAAFEREGIYHEPSPYGDPMPYTYLLIEQGRTARVFAAPLAMDYPVRLLQGTADTSVPVATALKIVEHAQCADLQLLLVKDADHRFSSPANLAQIEAALQDVLGA